MHKGKLGFRCSVYAVLAFVFALLGQPLFAMLAFGFAAAFERDEWTTRQCLEALLLSLAATVAQVVIEALASMQSTLTRLFPSTQEPLRAGEMLGFTGFMDTPRASAWSILLGLASVAVTVAVFVFALCAAMRVAKGKDAHTPVVWKWADAAYGLLPVKPEKQDDLHDGGEEDENGDDGEPGGGAR